MKIISRRSPLALLQVKEVMSLVPEVVYEVVATSSYGDRHKELSLMDGAVAADFFTRELDEALLAGRADIAIHSAKDLPYPLPAGIEVICLTRGGDKSDSLVSRGGVKLADLPAGSRVGTSSAMRRAELLALRPDLEVVSVRGCIEERIQQVDDGRIDALIVATCALERLGLAHRIAQRLPFRTHPLQGNLAITASANVSQEIRDLFAPFDIRRGFARVALVGFGPGDPELLTLRGERLLGEAQAILYDDLTNEAFLRRYKARKIYVGKRSGLHSHEQAEINELLYAEAVREVYETAAAADAPLATNPEKHPLVVRLKGGDPMLFSHGREEIDFLQSRLVEVEVVPGVSSGAALASALKIPLTQRGVARSAAFVLGHGQEVQTPSADTLIYYMGGGQLAEIARRLIASGRAGDTPVAIVANVSLPAQRTFYATLDELRWATCRATPVLIMVGRVVEAESANHIMRTWDTGTQGENPLIRIVANDISQPTPRGFDWVMFTSRYGVRHYHHGLDGVRVASVGPVTSAELRINGVEPDFESETQSAEGLLAHFATLPPQRILLPRSDKGLRALSDGLAAQGHMVADVPVYHNLPNPDVRRADLTALDKIIFTSPSTVEAFISLYGRQIPQNLLLIAKGKSTYEALQTI